MAVKYLDAKRLQGTNAERVALTATPILQSETATDTSSTVKPSHSGWTAELGIQIQSDLNGESMGSVTIKGTRSGSIAGNMWITHYDGSTGTPTSTKSVEQASNNASDGSSAEITFTFSTPITLATDDALLFSYTQAGVGTAYFTLDVEAGGGGTGYTGGYVTRNNAGTWSIVSPDYGVYMIVYGVAETLNLPAGTIFSTTDTYKYYWWNGTDTWSLSG